MPPRRRKQQGEEVAEENRSKSAKKRESAALQKLGEELVALAPASRAELDLPPALLDALALHDKISSREAARRQRQFIGRLMREADAVAIGQALARQKQVNASRAAAFKRAEKWRSQLLDLPEENLDNIFAEILEAAAKGRKSMDLAALKGIAQDARAEKARGSSGAFPASGRLFALLADIPV